MKMGIFLFVLANCIGVVFIAASIIFLAMVRSGGKIALDCNPYGEGWIEFVVLAVLGLIGTAGWFELRRKWLLEKTEFEISNRKLIKYVLIGFLILCVMINSWILWVYLGD